MYLIYCFIAYLSFSLHNATINVAEIDGDIPQLYTGNSLKYLNFWLLLTGQIIPFIIMFFYTEWYWAILINLFLIFITMLIANKYIMEIHVIRKPPLNTPSRVDVRPSLIVNAISIIFLIFFL